MSSGSRTIEIPDEVCSEVEARWIGKEFPDLESFVRFVLETLLAPEIESLDRDEQQLLEQRLRDLGYL